MISQTHKLDVVPGGVTAVVHVKQYQTGESLVFELFSRFGDFEISAAYTECTVRGTKSDGNGYSANATCDPSNNTVTVQLTEQMTAVAGRQPYEITITDSSGRMITTTFVLDVHRAALDADTVVSESVIKEVQTVVEEYLEGGAADDIIDSAVEDWMDNHPEASTTVEDWSLTYKKLEKGTLGFVTPEMYGAKGDGVTDDTAAIQAAINSGHRVICFTKDAYKSTAININSNNVIINGCGATIKFGTASGFIIPSTAHGIELININSELTYVKGSGATTNYHIVIQGGTTSKYYANDIRIINCSFNGGVTGISASSVKGLIVDSCSFDGMVYKLEDLAGGYGVLLQSCIDVAIKRTRFVSGKYGRHDIYISVDQTKSAYINCENVVIESCVFDHSELELDESGHYYSGTTTPINVRASKMVAVSNCYFYSTVGIITLVTEDGTVDGVVVSKSVFDSPVFNSGERESKYAVNVSATNYNADIIVDGVTLLNVPSNYTAFARLSKCKAKIVNSDIGATGIQCNDDVTVQIDNVTTAITYYFIRFNAQNSTTKGYCRNVTFLETLIGEKYYYASGATVSDQFFEHGYSAKNYNNATYCYRNTVAARCGNVVQCSIGILKDLPQNTIVDLFTLDTEYRPRAEVNFVLVTRDNSKNLVQGWIYPDGKVKVYNLSTTTSGNLNVNETITYIGAN